MFLTILLNIHTTKQWKVFERKTEKLAKKCPLKYKPAYWSIGDYCILYSYIFMEKTNLEKEIYLGVHHDDDNQGKQELEDDREDGVAATGKGIRREERS